MGSLVICFAFREQGGPARYNNNGRPSHGFLLAGAQNLVPARGGSPG
jgi:hypothetical protein